MAVCSVVLRLFLGCSAKLLTLRSRNPEYIGHIGTMRFRFSSSSDSTVISRHSLVTMAQGRTADKNVAPADVEGEESVR
jgi:hypothetical protein